MNFATNSTVGILEINYSIGYSLLQLFPGFNLVVKKRTRIKSNLRIVNGNAIITVSINKRSGHNAGLTVGMSGIKGGMNYGTEESAGTLVRVTIPQHDPQLEVIANALRLATHQHQLMAIKARYPQINIITGKMTGHKENQAANIDSPFIGLGFNSSGEFSGTEFSDGSAEYRGANGLGGRLSILGLDMASNSSEELLANVDADGNAILDLQKTNTDFDFGKSIAKLSDNLENDPMGLLTGGAKSTVQSAEKSGTFITNKELDYLIGLANSPEYDNYINSPALRAQWVDCVRKIRAGKGDRKAASKALAEFMGENRHGHKEAIETMLESAGHRNGGARNEFPEGTTQLKPIYKSLLLGAPLAPIQQRLRLQKPKEALLLAQQLQANIAQVSGGLKAAADKFQDKSRLADMLSFLSKLNSQASALIYQLKNPKAKPKDLRKQVQKTKFDDALAQCQLYKNQEAGF